MGIDGGRVGTDTVRAWVSDVARLDPLDDADRVAALRALEELKGAAAAAQARITVAFAASQRAAQVAAGSRPAGGRRDRGPGGPGPARQPRQRIAASGAGPGLDPAALHSSRARGGAGQRVASHAGRPRDRLPPAAGPGGGRRRAGRPARWPGRSGRPRHRGRSPPDRLPARPHRVHRPVRPRCRRAAGQPAPGTRHDDHPDRAAAGRPGRRGPCRADAGRRLPALDGDARGRGQIMADTLVERVTGRPPPTAVPVEVQLVMADTALLARGSDQPAHVHGYGPVAARWARPGWPTPPPPSGYGGSTPARPGRPWSRWSPRRRRFTGGLRRFLDHPGPDLPHPLVRRPDSPCGPPHPAHRPRPHHRWQRTGPVCRLQPGEGSPRLARPHPR